MNWLLKRKIKREINKLLVQEKDKIEAIFVADIPKYEKYIQVQIYIIYQDDGEGFKRNSIKHNQHIITFNWESIENYKNIEAILENFIHSNLILNSIIFYDPNSFLKEIKKNIKSKNNMYLKNRISALYDGILNIEQDIEKINDVKNFLEYYQLVLYSYLIIPIVGTNQVPNKLYLFKQLTNGLKRLNLKNIKTSFYDLVGCSDIKKEEALFYVDNLMEMYDYCIDVQVEDYHGINKPKREYTYKNLIYLINKGYYKEVIYPILDLMWIINYRITQDIGDIGWWTMMTKGLEKRLDFTKSLWKKRKKALLNIKKIVEEKIVV